MPYHPGKAPFMTAVLEFKMDPDMRRALESRAKAEGRSLAEVTRSALRFCLAMEPLDLSRLAEVKPEDLLVNPFGGLVVVESYDDAVLLSLDDSSEWLAKACDLEGWLRRVS